ncbi:hypothetical protein BKA56DRAFT_725946 [Ilyonectria sp. MPI-CAGE-AT-0026]|nr:hypothetical protein BKA56DRAFT_725946 [Ilyonectria sp. MPI-CAGE-AT-0026]
MGQPRLDDMPPEVLGQICAPLVEEERKLSLLSLSRVSKRLRAFVLPDIFRELTPVFVSDKEELSQSSLPSLLRTMITNPTIASMVQDIDFTHHGNPIFSQEDVEIFVKAANLLGIPVPESVLQRPGRPSTRTEPWNIIRYEGEDGEILQFLMEMIAAHTPNLESLQYHVSDEGSVLQVLMSASNSKRDSPLLPRLRNVRIDHLATAREIRPLADFAPNLTSLRIDNTRGGVAGVRFENVTELVLMFVRFTGQELKDLLQGFPSLKDFFFNFNFCNGDPDADLCTPQQAVDALEPFKKQLTDVRLSFWDWQIFHHSTTGFPPGLITSMTMLEALEHLVLDGRSLWRKVSSEEENYNAEAAQLFVKMLPRSLKTLALIRLDSETYGDDLMVLAPQIKSCCPELQSIYYQLHNGSEMNKRRLTRITKLFAEQGVAFEKW